MSNEAWNRLDETGRTCWWEPRLLHCEPVKVQGMTISPGETVLVTIDGKTYAHLYKGWAHVEEATPAQAMGACLEPDERTDFIGCWMDTTPGTGPGMWPGPYRLDSLKHPNILEGMAREIDAD